MRFARWLVVLSMLSVGTVMIASPPPKARADELVTEAVALAQAASSEEPVQVTSETTSTMDVWAQPDGTLTADISSGPVRVQDPNDPTAWVPIDTTLSDTGTSITPAAAATDLSFSDGGTDPVATMAVGTDSFGLETESSLPAPTLSGNTATYADVQPGVDLVVSALPEGFTESYVVDAAEHAPEFITFPLALEGLSASVDESGALVLTDANDQTVAQAAPARMWGATLDTSGLPVAEQEVPVEVVDHGDGPVLTVTPDPAFFTHEDVTYPVTIDPSTDLTATDDTYVRSDHTGTSYGNYTVLLAGSDSSRTTRSYLHFDVSGLAGKLVTGAELKLFETSALSCSAPEMDVLALEDDWTESTPWSTKPADPAADDLVGTTTQTLGYSGSCPSGWVTIDAVEEGALAMADLVNVWLMGILDNNGIELRAENEGDPTTWRRFKSSEAGSNLPTLSVAFIAGADAAALETLPEFAANYLVDSGAIEPGPAFDGCIDETSPDADMTDPYESYMRGQDTVDVNGDVFWPDGETGTYPLLILAHGGGWWRGCRGALNNQAEDLSANFVVYDIDYRMACDPDDPNLENSPIRGLCGYVYKDADTLSGGFGYGQPGSSIHDILNAVAWARDHVNSEWCPWNCWDGETVFVGGGSAGGNLAEVAAALGYADQGEAYQVNGTFSWSGPLELGTPTCGLRYSRGPGICFGETNQYVCGNWTPPGHQALLTLDEACLDDANWNHQNDFEQAGPYFFYTDTDGDLLPKIFFANGGFCSGGAGGGCNEDMGWLGSDDLQRVMDENEFTNFSQCRVAAPKHGTRYLNDEDCVDDVVTVFTATVAYLLGP